MTGAFLVYLAILSMACGVWFAELARKDRPHDPALSLIFGRTSVCLVVADVGFRIWSTVV